MTRNQLFPRPIAHRGLHDFAAGIIENTASAFEAAIAANYAIECDVQLSSDGVPYIFHDDDLERLVGRHGRSDAISIAEITSLPLVGSAIGDRPQRFTEFLGQVAGRTQLQIELKQQATPEGTRKLAEAVTAALSRYIGEQVIESFDPNLLVAMRRAGYRGKLGIITYSWRIDEWDWHIPAHQKFILRHLLHWPVTRFNFISCHDQALDLPAVRFFRGLGIPVTSWTIKSPQRAREVMSRADQIVFEGFEPT